MGSVWQALAFGFAGLHPLGETLRLDPHLPPSWSALDLNVQHRGVGLGVRIEPGSVTVRAEAPVVLEIAGRRVSCSAGRTEIPFDTPGDAP